MVVVNIEGFRKRSLVGRIEEEFEAIDQVGE